MVDCKCLKFISVKISFYSVVQIGICKVNTKTLWNIYFYFSNGCLLRYQLGIRDRMRGYDREEVRVIEESSHLINEDSAS